VAIKPGDCRSKSSELIMSKSALLIALTLLAACSHVPNPFPVKIDSTVQEDGPPAEQRDVSKIPDATPKPVKRTRAGNKSPYTVFGKTYELLSQSKGYRERGGASWYGTKFHGRNTANGERYDMWAMTAAHKTLPIPSYVRVTNLNNGLSVVVRVNDRGPFHGGRIIDLSYAAASKLGFANQGTAPVEVVDVTPTKEPAPQVSQSIAPPSTTILQVAAFKEQQKAIELQNKLQRQLGSSIAVNVAQAGDWYRVRVGPLNKQQLAMAYKVLAEQGISSPVPVLK
jgi:rare lipoprotein A